MGWRQSRKIGVRDRGRRSSVVVKLVIWRKPAISAADLRKANEGSTSSDGFAPNRTNVRPGSVLLELVLLGVVCITLIYICGSLEQERARGKFS